MSTPIGPVPYGTELVMSDYVLQRALTVADQDQKEALVELIKPHLANMRKVSHHGRHLVASKLSRNVPHPSAAHTT